MHKYKGYTLRNISVYANFPIYGVFNPEGKEVENTLFPSEFKEIVKRHIKAHSV